jgi:hypothetical protein
LLLSLLLLLLLLLLLHSNKITSIFLSVFLRYMANFWAVHKKSMRLAAKSAFLKDTGEAGGKEGKEERGKEEYISLQNRFLQRSLCFLTPGPRMSGS